MADLLRMRGLVAGAGFRPDARPAEQARGTQRAEAVTGRDLTPGPAAADRVEVSPPSAVNLRAGEMELRQRALTTQQARIDALDRVADGLTAVRDGRGGALEALRDEAGGLRGLFEPGPNMAQLLVRVEPGSARAIDPGLVGAAMVEVENARAAAYGALNAEGRELSVARVAAENGEASRVAAERLERAAELMRRSEAEGQPAGLLEAFRAAGLSRARVVELLSGGGIA